MALALLVGLPLLWVGNEVAAEDPDYSNTFTNAQSLPLGTGRGGNLGTGGDVDIFTFTVAAGTTEDVWFYTVGVTP